MYNAAPVFSQAGKTPLSVDVNKKVVFHLENIPSNLEQGSNTESTAKQRPGCRYTAAVAIHYSTFHRYPMRDIEAQMP
jgi:hypothetical protein